MKTIQAEILTIGDEILYGQITDTNSQWISEQLTSIGIKVIRKTSVGDEGSEMVKAIQEAELRADLIIITGGLGPTSDDLTKPVLTQYFNTRLILHEEALKDLTAFFERRGRELTEINRQQAYLPASCTIIRNYYGTAPGMWFERNGKVLISMPGVPYEMKAMITEQLIPKIRAFFNPPVIIHKMIRTSGIGESFLADKIKSWEESLPSFIKLAYLPSLDGVRLRLTAITDKEKETETDNFLEKEQERLREIIEDYIYGYGEDNQEQALGKLLIKHKLTIGSAESCTGGMVSATITSAPGSSEYFKGGIVSYDNEVKINVLGVKKETLAEYGAVSEATVIEMVNGVQKLLKTDIAVATTGIAGPGGGSAEKPVGTIWIAVRIKNKTKTKKLQLGNIRENNIKMTTYAVFNLIRETLREKN
ncbi:competence/damage-inducible protein CinA [Sporocytophaga myxococcoides]|uniref:CinA-like protein n=1 Tax=Sporocytophaga myxococcoides TaxID=153721 RepID=A0A098LJV7_9BACT|nr:competence/damage-inducible protein A [Sporocytophaga myxococcoides]GAL86458.1 competence/damage-inducible protein CinA [Sporocytophaga myxococcoides]